MISGHKFLFKFVDEEGKFLGDISGPQEPHFVEAGGVEFLTEDAARTAWRVYEFYRLSKGDRPSIKLRRYKLTVEELSTEDFTETPANMRLTGLLEVYGNTPVAKFIRALYQRPDFMEFSFIVVRNERDLVRNRKSDSLDLSAMPNAVISSRKTDRRFIAVKTEGELAFLRMSLKNRLRHAIVLDTGKTIMDDADYDRD